jgi:hypothetical protein
MSNSNRQEKHLLRQQNIAALKSEAKYCGTASLLARVFGSEPQAQDFRSKQRDIMDQIRLIGG